MIHSDVVCCFGPPKTGTTWLYDNLVLNSNFNSFYDIKEINIWSKWSPPHAPEDEWRHNPLHSEEEYFNAIEVSEKPILDFTLCYKEALMEPDNVKRFTDRFDVTFICILRDPVDILISGINFMNMYGLITNSKKPEPMQHLLSLTKHNNGLKHFFGAAQYSEWLPSWENYNIKYLDYSRFSDTDYINTTLDIDIEYPIATSNVTKNKKLRKDRMNPDTLEVLQNFYQKDLDYIMALKDK